MSSTATAHGTHCGECQEITRSHIQLTVAVHIDPRDLGDDLHLPYLRKRDKTGHQCLWLDHITEIVEAHAVAQMCRNRSKDVAACKRGSGSGKMQVGVVQQHRAFDTTHHCGGRHQQTIVRADEDTFAVRHFECNGFALRAHPRIDDTDDDFGDARVWRHVRDH